MSRSLNGAVGLFAVLQSLRVRLIANTPQGSWVVGIANSSAGMSDGASV
jgi:hypothetical protein